MSFKLINWDDMKIWVFLAGLCICFEAFQMGCELKDDIANAKKEKKRAERRARENMNDLYKVYKVINAQTLNANDTLKTMNELKNQKTK